MSIFDKIMDTMHLGNEYEYDDDDDFDDDYEEDRPKKGGIFKKKDKDYDYDLTDDVVENDKPAKQKPRKNHSCVPERMATVWKSAYLNRHSLMNPERLRIHCFQIVRWY